jgi:hypothetical protein
MRAYELTPFKLRAFPSISVASGDGFVVSTVEFEVGASSVLDSRLACEWTVIAKAKIRM